jgi:tRNA A-37 threonylcarbamoyl transferase component Bud32
MTEVGERQIPAEHAEWLAETHGDWIPVGDASWSRPNSNVWCIELDGALAFMKISPSRSAFEREVVAYSDWLPEFRATGTALPRLLSFEESLSVVVTSALDGEVVRTMQAPLSMNDEQEIHRAAGSGVRAMHGLRFDDVSGQQEEMRQARVGQLLQDAERRFAISAAVLTTFERTTIARARDLLLENVGACQIGFIHGDFQPRNWLWSATSQTVGFIDFEESRLGFCLEDFGWLLGALWHRRPDLCAAFSRGYGRQLNASEQQFLTAFTALGSLLHIADGRELGISQKIDNGRAALAVAGAAMEAGAALNREC